MDEQNTNPVNPQTTTMTIADLKTAFDQAVEERRIVDAKIAEIKKQIQAQRKQYEDLDKKTDIYTGSETTSSDIVIPCNRDENSFDYLKDLGKSLLHFVVKYLIPIIIILAFLGVYIHRNASVHTTYATPIEAVLVVSQEEACQTYPGSLI